MLKRTLIAVAVIGLLVTSAQAVGPDPTFDTHGKERGFKIDPIKMSVFWPVEYKALDLCVIPVRVQVGILVEVQECHKRKINLKQVDCADINKGSGEFPCYRDCEDVKVRTNFPIKLGTRRNTISNVLNHGRWRAFYDGDNTLEPTGTSWKTVTLCVEAWRLELLNHETSGNADDWIKIAEVAMTVKPNV